MQTAGFTLVYLHLHRVNIISGDIQIPKGMILAGFPHDMIVLGTPG